MQREMITIRINNLEVYGVIYKITNKINDKIYIGQTVQGFDRRYHNKGGDTSIERLYLSTHNEHLKYSIDKYGFDNFEINKIFDVAFSLEELNIKEEMWIRYYDSTNRDKGYNIMFGGDNHRMSEETKNKIRQARKGKEPWNKGLKNIYSKKTLNKMSISKIGDNNGFYGKHHSKDFIKKLSDYKKIKVICLTTNKVFNSAKEAGFFYGLKGGTHITACCKGKRNYCGKLEDGTKLQWMYYEDYLKEAS